LYLFFISFILISVVASPPGGDPGERRPAVKKRKKVLRLSSETLYDLESKAAVAAGNLPCTGLTGKFSCCPP
jgi:hypothetical protein